MPGAARSTMLVGGRPEETRILDNGSNVAADVEAKLHYPEIVLAF